MNSKHIDTLSFARNLTSQVKEKGGTTLISEVANVSRQMLKRYMAGEAEPRLTVLLRLVVALDTSVARLCSSDPCGEIVTPAPPALPYLDDKFIPEHKRIAHGSYSDKVSGKCSLCAEFYSNQFHVPLEELRLFYIDNNSMAPTLKLGELAIVSLSSDHTVGGDGIFLLRNARSLIIRRVQSVSTEQCYATTDNDKYEPFSFKPGKEYDVVGRLLVGMSCL